MGIEDRDYMADETPARWGRSPSRGQWSMVTTLIVINVVIFFLQTLTMESRILERWFALIISDVLRLQIWRLTTYDFLHQTGGGLPLHLLFNMLLLWIAGTRVEAKYGSREFLAFYLLAGILSGVGFMAWGLFTHSNRPAIGASGAAVALMIVYAMNWPHERWYIWGILPVPVYLLAIFSAAFDVLPMIQQISGQAPQGNIAHAAHLGGMLFGLLYVYFRWNITDVFAGWDTKRFQRDLSRRRKLKVHIPKPHESALRKTVSETSIPETIPKDVESRLDSLLEKISNQGEASLTQEERNFLAETSRRFRNRK